MENKLLINNNIYKSCQVTIDMPELTHQAIKTEILEELMSYF